MTGTENEIEPHAWPPPTLPTDRADATPVLTTHAADHNAVNLAINDLTWRVQGNVTEIADLQNKVNALLNANAPMGAPYWGTWTPGGLMRTVVYRNASLTNQFGMMYATVTPPFQFCHMAASCVVIDNSQYHGYTAQLDITNPPNGGGATFLIFRPDGSLVTDTLIEIQATLLGQ